MQQEKKDLHIVMGISSAGKSTFIKNSIEKGLWKKAVPIIMAHELTEGSINLIHNECVIHYNLFRPYNNSVEHIEKKFLSDIPLNILLREKHRVKVTILVTKRNVLAKRILLRDKIESTLRLENSKYPSESIFELLCNINMIEFYGKWFDLLNQLNIPFQIIESETNHYREFKNSKEALSWLQETSVEHYSDLEIAKIIKKFKFEYQEIKLSDGSITKGDSRSATLDIISKHFSGKSVLDIGCAYGYFCFEAEKYNARMVTGTELKQHRFIGANILKELNGSCCNFVSRDVFEEPFAKKFDVVLFLNVIHHTKEPIRALRMVAQMAKEVFIIEFPNIKDEKFSRTFVQNEKNLCDSLPLIGVSLLEAEDQTFLFNEEAIRRILMEHDTMCSQIDFIQSPMSPDRKIAICYK